MITADNITDEQIRDLRLALTDEKDWKAASIASMALWQPLSGTDRMYLMEPYHSHALKHDAHRKHARARCADILNARQAATP